MPMFKIGDKVKVIRNWTESEGNTVNCGQIPTIDQYIGNIYTIQSISHFGNYQFEGYMWKFPECVLIKISDMDILEEQTPFNKRCVHCGNKLSEDCEESKICESCQEDYHICVRCDDSYHIDDLKIGPDDEYYCENCYDIEFGECYNCGNILPHDELYSNDLDEHEYCSNCDSEIFTSCDDCGSTIYRNDACNTNDNTYCESCYEENHNTRLLHDYGYSPSLTFNDVDSKKYEDSNAILYMGLELEVDDGENAHTFLESNEIFFEDLPIYFCHDGSLGDEGIEMISHPCTLQYHLSNIPYAEIFKMFRRDGYKSHDTDTCGLHCHINKSYLGLTPDEIDINIAKILIFYERSWNNIIKFSRRTPSQYNQWCKRYAMSTDNDDQIKELLDTAKNADRYYAVNLSNYRTIEFRVFRGTLNINTFISTLQFIESVVQFIKSIPINDHQQINWDRYKEYILNESVTYMTLINYLDIRGL